MTVFLRSYKKATGKLALLVKKEIFKDHTVGTSSFELLAVGTGIQDYPCSDLDDHI